MKEYKIILPLVEVSVLNQLHVGDKVYISGELFVFRDQVHKKIFNQEIQQLIGINFRYSGLYYCAATAPKYGLPVGSCGPTSSYRMDDYTEAVLQLGVKVMIGKGYRSEFISSLCRKYNAVYLITYGGCGAYLNQFVKETKLVAYPELATEAMYKFVVEDFPGIVSIDVYGNTLWNRL